jgi:hypothetical protein
VCIEVPKVACSSIKIALASLLRIDLELILSLLECGEETRRHRTRQRLWLELTAVVVLVALTTWYCDLGSSVY